MNNFFKIFNTQSVHPEIARNFKRNFFANVFDAGFWFLGDSFVAAYTIMPVFMSTLTDSPILIGLMPALADAGWFIPQIFFAKILESRNRRLPIVLKLALFDRLPYLLLVFGTLMLANLDANVAVIFFLIIYLIKSFLHGLVALPWQELIATVIPVSHRGRYWGSSLILGKMMGLIGAAIAGYLLTNIVYPTNYVYMFSLGFISGVISYFFLRMNIEPEIKRSSFPEKHDLSLWNKMGNILSADKNFLKYLINRGLAFLSVMGMGFVAVYGIQKFDLPLSYSAVFTMVMLIAEIFGYGIWGTLGDKMGYKRVIEFSNLFLIIGLLILIFVDSLWGLYLVFGVLSLAHSGEYVADQNIAMEFGEEADRPTYIGMSKTLTGPFLLIAPIIGGLIVNMWGYQRMFTVALVFSTLAFVTIRFFVSEPRLSN